MKYLWPLLLLALMAEAHSQVVPGGGNSVTPTNTVTLTNKYLSGDTYDTVNFQTTGLASTSWSMLTQRQAYTATAVMIARPYTANSVMAVDIAPNGFPAAGGTAAMAWLDVCDGIAGDLYSGQPAFACAITFDDGSYAVFGSHDGSLATTITSFALSSTVGNFTCTCTSLYPGQIINISGVFGGTGSITGYTNPTRYVVVSVTGVQPNITGGKLQSLGLGGLTTTSGTPSGLTYTRIAQPICFPYGWNNNEPPTCNLQVDGNGATVTQGLYMANGGSVAAGKTGFVNNGTNQINIIIGGTSIGGFLSTGLVAVPIGASSPATGGFTTLTASGAVTFPGLATSSAGTTGTVCWTTGTGNLNVDTTTTCLLSDGRLKMNVQPLDVGIEEVMKLNPVSYDLKPEANPTHLGRQVGLVAQDVMAIDPRLASTYQSGPNKGTPSGVRYEQMVALLVKAVQEQQHEIDDLKKQIKHTH